MKCTYNTRSSNNHSLLDIIRKEFVLIYEHMFVYNVDQWG